MVLASIAYGLCHVLAGREFLPRVYKGFSLVCSPAHRVQRAEGISRRTVCGADAAGPLSLARVRRQRLAQTPQSAKSARVVATRYQASHFWQPWVLGS